MVRVENIKTKEVKVFETVKKASQSTKVKKADIETSMEQGTSFTSNTGKEFTFSYFTEDSKVNEDSAPLTIPEIVEKIEEQTGKYLMVIETKDRHTSTVVMDKINQLILRDKSKHKTMLYRECTEVHIDGRIQVKMIEEGTVPAMRLFGLNFDELFKYKEE